MTSEDCTVLDDLSAPLDAVKTHIIADESTSVFRCKVPDLCKAEECIVGIDEAGRGPVLGKSIELLKF